MIINILTFICVTAAHQLPLADTNVVYSNRLLDASSRSFIPETIATDSSDSFTISQADTNEFLSNLKKSTLDNLLLRNERSTSLSDRNRDEQLVLENNIEEEWNYLLTSGPLTINRLNSLLVYVADTIYSTLLSLHAKMLQIQFNNLRLSSYINTSTKLLVSNSSKIIDFMLPKLLADLDYVANESVIHTRTIIDRLQNSHDLISEVMQISAYTHSAQAVGSGKKRSYAFEPTYNNQEHRTKEFDGNSQLDTKNKSKEYRPSSDVKSFQIANTIPQSILNGFTTVVETIKDNNLLKAGHIENERDIERFDIKTNQQRAARSIIGGGVVSRPNKQEIQDIIVNSNIQINQIMVQWSRLMIFFHKLVAQVEPVHKSILKDYIEPIKDLKDGILHLDSAEKEFFLSMLVGACQSIDEQADLLYAMSKAYTDISSEYIINQTINMNLLILQSNDEKASYLREISNQITLITPRVIQLAEDQKNHHFARINNRRREYQQILVDFTGRKKTAD
ncbi:unnamed protein product [Rotaria socialis]|uniref:Uncharacterized protein n=2 Tax=Rotaria socialis TaxID=392032 RepID=A0A820IJY1_9BILA|nr:unnamed protein product [Rotaria socialis]